MLQLENLKMPADHIYVGDGHYLCDDSFNALRGGRQEDREAIAWGLRFIAGRHGAALSQHHTEAVGGVVGMGLSLDFSLNGVGAFCSIDSLFEGKTSVLSWHNTEYPLRNFTTAFCEAIGSPQQFGPYHKATSAPLDWYSLAKLLDAGLCLAARGEALEPSA